MLGETFSFSQLFAILGSEAEQGTHRFLQVIALTELREAGFVVADDPERPDQWRFARENDRQGVLEALGDAERERLRGRIERSTL